MKRKLFLGWNGWSHSPYIIEEENEVEERIVRFATGAVI
jgi:hypothetical protein